MARTRISLNCGIVCSLFAVIAIPISPLTAPSFADGIDPRFSSGGVVILDNCDPQFRGKEEYQDNLASFDRNGKLQFRISGFNGAEGIGSNHRVVVDSASHSIWTLE